MSISKAIQLRKHKRLATGLFILMALVYILMIFLQKQHAASWMGYVEAFSEAAMVGALADWFAVTALFHHPLGLPIPHTNLIEKSKQSIGNNLGSFVVNNFLTPENIRPYLMRLKVAELLSDWLSKEKNKNTLQDMVGALLRDIVSKLDDQSVSRFLSQKGAELLERIPLQQWLASAIHYIIKNKEHEQLITSLALKIQQYIQQEEQMVADRVKQESFFFVPKFVNNKLAKKISTGLMGYFGEIAADPNHKIRHKISAQLSQFADDIEQSERWEQELNKLKKGLVSGVHLNQYAEDIWSLLKQTLINELEQEDSTMNRYFSKTIDELALRLQEDIVLQQRIDSWVRLTGYKYILRNTDNVGALISNTVGNWEGRELSSKLELEVGKDLQFIRINGTLVGGLVGLLIYLLTEMIR